MLEYICKIIIYFFTLLQYKTMKKYDINPTNEWYFGSYWGQILPPDIKKIFDEITEFYLDIKDTKEFTDELKYYRKYYIWRPSPIFYAKNISEKIWWWKIYLKREDLNHTGAHKINHCIGEVLLAKKMWKKRVIAETGAWQHWVALATACALFDMPCEIFMWEVDIEKEAPNVTRMKILWAKVTAVTTWTKTLKDAVDAALGCFLQDPQNIFFGIWSVVWPHPFPMIVRDLQRIVGEEAREQFQELTWKLPDNLVACVWGGSNAIWLFSTFLEDEEITIYGVEPSWKSLNLWENAATLTLWKPWNLHGMHTYLLQDEKWNPQPVYSIASWLDYPWVWPQHSFLKDTWRVHYEVINDKECIAAFYELSRTEWIIPALESAHAVAYAMKLAKTLSSDQTILVNLSWRWDKDIDFVINNYPIN